MTLRAATGATRNGESQETLKAEFGEQSWRLRARCTPRNREYDAKPRGLIFV